MSRVPQPTRPAALTIAGSDSGGGAGIEADLRVFHRLGVFGTCAITALTAQNLRGVAAVAGVDPAVVAAQVQAVLAGFDVRAAKTGMLWSAGIVDAVAAAMAGRNLPLVVDPVMVASTGARLVDPSAIESYRRSLLPLATLITPNLDEAAVLLQRDRIEAARHLEAARELHARFGVAVLLKGGHLAGDPIDVLATAGDVVAWRHDRIRGVNTHGSGCMLAAAITARLTSGDALPAACEAGLSFVHDALRRGLHLANGEILADVEHASADPAALQRL